MTSRRSCDASGSGADGTTVTGPVSPLDGEFRIVSMNSIIRRAHCERWTEIVPIVRIKVAGFHGIMKHDWAGGSFCQDRAQCRRARSAHLADKRSSGRRGGLSATSTLRATGRASAVGDAHRAGCGDLPHIVGIDSTRRRGSACGSDVTDGRH